MERSKEGVNRKFHGDSADAMSIAMMNPLGGGPGPSRRFFPDAEIHAVRRADIRIRPGELKEGLDSMVALAEEGVTLIVVTHEIGAQSS